MPSSSPLPTSARRLRLRPGWIALACAALLVGLPPRASVAETPLHLPSLGDAVSDELDLRQERHMGDNIMREIRRDPDYLEDPLLNEYLDSIFQPLVQAARQVGSIDPAMDRSFAWQSFLIGNHEVNAFALPGGYIGVYLGMIALTGTPDEFASVLAHELTHITQRHIGRGMVNASHQSVASVAALVLGMLAASRARSVDAAQAVVMGSQAMMAQGQLNFSRDMEREADHIGLQLMEAAGFEPSGMASMFGRLQFSTRLNDNDAYPFLRDHPLTGERIADARLHLGEHPAVHRGPSLTEHLLMRARAQVLMDRSETALQRLEGQGQPGSPAVDAKRLATLYAAGLAATQLRDFGRADQAIDAGLTLARERFAAEPKATRDFTLLKLSSLIDRLPAGGAPASAVVSQIDALVASLAADRSRTVQLARAQAALARARAGDPAAQAALRASTEELQTWVAEHRDDALAWQTLSQCAAPLGLTLRSLRAGAEAAAARGDLNGAVDRFLAAQKAARGAGPDQYLEATIIESRLHDVENERRALRAETSRNGGGE